MYEVGSVVTGFCPFSLRDSIDQFPDVESIWPFKVKRSFKVLSLFFFKSWRLLPNARTNYIGICRRF